MSRSRASGSGSSSGQPHEHDADLVGRGPPPSQRDRHRDRKPGRARFTGGGQGRHVPGTDGREQRIVHGRPDWAHARLECRKVGVHEGDPVPRAALTEQHRGADPAADERRQHALKAEAHPSEEARHVGSALAVRPSRRAATSASARPAGAVEVPQRHPAQPARRAAARSRPPTSRRRSRGGCAARGRPGRHSRPARRGAPTEDARATVAGSSAAPHARSSPASPATGSTSRMCCSTSGITSTQRCLRPSATGTRRNGGSSAIRARSAERRAARSGRPSAPTKPPGASRPAMRNTLTWPTWSSTRFASSTAASRPVADRMPPA